MIISIDPPKAPTAGGYIATIKGQYFEDIVIMCYFGNDLSSNITQIVKLILGLFP